ncbi:hypothetical protein [Nonomuraea jabiensis]|uniref:hypothetical protein n=1 Tax=Nonomuraea jabiensis TaxID=882448 RepID=UPI003D744171
MAEKVITVCDWHETDVEAVKRNRWTNPAGKRKRNDLCEEHQKEFESLWERVELGSALDTEEAPARAPRRKAGKGALGEPALIKAWLRSLGRGDEVKGSGRVPFHLEQEWKDAGRPNVLEEG